MKSPLRAPKGYTFLSEIIESDWWVYSESHLRQLTNGGAFEGLAPKGKAAVVRVGINLRRLNAKRDTRPIAIANEVVDYLKKECLQLC